MRRGAIAAVAVCLCAVCAVGQDTRNPAGQPPTDMKEGMEMMFGAMAPMMAKMTEMMLEGQLKIVEKPETAVRIATFKKNLFDALQKQGFSKDEAFTIMLHTAPPAIGGGMMK